MGGVCVCVCALFASQLFCTLIISLISVELKVLKHT